VLRRREDFSMLSAADRYVIARENNIVRVDFRREPDPPAPCFPGANGLRLTDTEHDGADAPTTTAVLGDTTGGLRMRSKTSMPTWHVCWNQKVAGHLESRAEMTNSVRC
jgi:hypothetical protein